MNRITAKQLVRLNETVIGKNELKISDEQMEKLKRIEQAPYIMDKELFYIYKTTIEKSAKLGCEIFKEKPFEEENGLTAILAILTLLDLNGMKLVNYQDDFKELANGIKNNDIKAVTTWIRSHLADNIYIMPESRSI